MNKNFLLASVLVIVFACTLEVAGGRGKFGLVNCKKLCIRNCTETSKPACKLGCLRDCANQALEKHEEDEGRIWVGEEGPKHRCKRTCKRECARKPPMCKHRCMRNCTSHHHGNSSENLPFNHGKKLNGGMRVPAFCLAKCASNCTQQIQCTGNCLERCDRAGVGRVQKCKKHCKIGRECIFPACSQCKVSCLSDVSQCWRTRCDHLCHPDKEEVDLDTGDEKMSNKRVAKKLRRKSTRDCKICRAGCDRDGRVEPELLEEVDH